MEGSKGDFSGPVNSGQIYKGIMSSDSSSKMNEIQIHATLQALKVIKRLMRDVPDVYADIELTALKHIFNAGMKRNLSVSELARLLRCTEQEACNKMTAVCCHLAKL